MRLKIDRVGWEWKIGGVEAVILALLILIGVWTLTREPQECFTMQTTGERVCRYPTPEGANYAP